MSDEAKKKVKVHIEARQGQSCLAEELSQVVADVAGSENGGDTWHFINQGEFSKRAAKKIARWYAEGNIDDYIHVVPIGKGERIGVLEADGLTILATLSRDDVAAAMEAARDGHDEWNALVPVELRFRDYSVTRVEMIAGFATFIGGNPVVISVLGQVLSIAVRSVAKFFYQMTQVAPELIPGGEAAALLEAEAEVPEEGSFLAEDISFDISLTATTGAYVVAGAILAAGIIVEVFLTHVMHHRLAFYNGTSFDVDWKIGHIDAGQLFAYPPPSKNGDHKGRVGTAGRLQAVHEKKFFYKGKEYPLGYNEGEHGSFAGVTSDFAEGVGWVLELHFTDRTGKGREMPPLYAKLVVPYDGDNKIAFIVGSREIDTPTKAWEHKADDVAALRIERKLDHGVHGELTMDLLSGTQVNPYDTAAEPGYFYDSMLYLSEKGVWHGSPPKPPGS